jgi:hypothetical protein
MMVSMKRNQYIKMLMEISHFIIGKASIIESESIQRKEKMLTIPKKIKMLKGMLPTNLINTIIFQILMLLRKQNKGQLLITIAIYLQMTKVMKKSYHPLLLNQNGQLTRKKK